MIMNNKFLLKNISVAIVAAGLAACGGSNSSNGGDDAPTAPNANLSSNPAFTFDNTDYAGAVKSGANNWWNFAIAGTVPTTPETTPYAAAGGTGSAGFESDVSFSDVAYTAEAIAPAAKCPTAEDPNYSIVDSGNTYDMDGKTFKVCDVTGSILKDETFSNDVVWALSGRVNVGNGNRELVAGDNVVKDVTLTVEAGTVFRSKTGSSLVVTRGSEIQAVGTAAQPIIMWAEGDDDFNDRGAWGGLVLQGYAYNNNCGDPSNQTYCNLNGEGASGYFGGFDNSDSSGTLKYVVIAEAGSELSNGDELNGVGFMSVGYGTTIDYIQIHQNDDDGVEFFGGAVDAKHLVLTSNKDDDIDWDEGYVGNIQYGVIVKTSSKSGSRHAFELDTKGDAYESAYQESNPTVANVTALSLLADDEVTDGTETLTGDAIHLKEGSEGRFFNILLLGDFNNCVKIKDTTNYTTAENANASFVNVYGDCMNDSSIPVTFTLDDLNVDAAYNGVDAQTAETNVPALTATTITSEEVDGSAN
jgi:hypothetical protein